jgi:hypothetical protein
MNKFKNGATSDSEKENTTNLIASDWSGILDIGIAQMAIVLHFKKESDGILNGTFDYLQEKMYGLMIDLITLDGESLKFEIKIFSVKFEGNLIKNGSEISGHWIQYGKLFPITFEKGIKSFEAPSRPQEPKKPYPYTEEFVSYTNPTANVNLSGTLTLPSSPGPFPVAILIAGAGQSDRDATMLGHKPFWILADHLTRQGIAVLRFDKRGCGKSTGNFNTATTQDFAEDVRAGIEYLKSRNDINLKQIGLIGHSEGGIIAPMVAANSHDIVFIVLMAACGVNGEEIMYGWGASVERANGSTQEAIDKDRQQKKERFLILKKEPDFDKAAKQLREVIEVQKQGENCGSEAIDAEVNYMNTRWFRYFLTYDPATALRQVKIPVLALNGELDQQILPKENLPIISKALEDGGNKDYSIVELPKLNHLFQTCHDGSFGEYAKIEETVSPIVLNLIAEWILEKTTNVKHN